MFKEVKHTLENSAINPGNKLVRAKKKKKKRKKRFPNFDLVPESEIMRESN